MRTLHPRVFSDTGAGEAGLTGRRSAAVRIPKMPRRAVPNGAGTDSAPRPNRPPDASDAAAAFLRWSWMCAALHRGYWLVASLYLVIDARLSPAQLVLIGVAQGIVSLLFEIPTGVVADTVCRRWSLVIFHALGGTSMILTGLVTSFAALVGAQMLWGVAWTFVSGADVAWITDELDRPERTAAVLAAQARWQQIGAVCGMIGLGALTWVAGRGAAMVIAGAAMALLGLYVVARFTERRFSPDRGRGRQRFTATLRRGAALARLDPLILVIFAATFLINGAADTFGRLFPKRLIDLGFPAGVTPIAWLTGLGAATYVAGALALRLVERRIGGPRAARHDYAAACAIGACGVLLLAAAPNAVSGSLGVLVVAGIAWPVTRVAGVILVNERVTSDVRATVQSFLAQVTYVGEICFGLALAVVAGAASISAALVCACALTAGAGMVVARAHEERRGMASVRGSTAAGVTPSAAGRESKQEGDARVREDARR